MQMETVHEVILWMEDCAPERLTPNTVMLCVRNMFMLENMRDFLYDEYVDIIKRSGNAGIVKF
ncbi:hypothetical protein ANME2D_03258 [Candidatus Methanoperedens nitroreducens]|uniref:Uncharacterized protein n=1 Tax=Candidatus Methanoperedens nitratireducens TaxID=1392998 RepID=A0A062V3L3_9EURY|nr:hypothetical protein [Candidatus Methanoperedens nitroreducens]KCZ71223.1 hypothetical protein ANME2D_03258 [Candidatus Methanoperedens nitroreducens]MDJ1421395.1 hypothetical protein [Candidatus Methanoperedens sp.]